MNLQRITIAILAITSSVCQTGGSEAALRGFVVDARTNKPVSLAHISAPPNYATQDGMTDGNGYFRLPLASTIKSGDPIRIRVDKTGYEAYDEIITASAEATRIALTPQSRSVPRPAPTEPPGVLGVKGAFRATMTCVPQAPRPGEIFHVTVSLTNVSNNPVSDAVVHIESYTPAVKRLEDPQPQQHQTFDAHQTHQYSIDLVDPSPEQIRIAVGIWSRDYKTQYDWIEDDGRITVGETAARP